MPGSISESGFGTSTCGSACSLYTLGNTSGLEAKVTNYGATLVALSTPDKNGDLGNICLGFDTLDEYERQQVFMGAVVGRYSNRIANARFTLGEQSYPLDANLGRHTLHGGKSSFGRRPWSLESAAVVGGVPTLTLIISSPDCESGFPGRVDAKVTYRLFDDNRLRMSFYVEADKTTPISMTHHAYFNLSASTTSMGRESLTGHQFEIDSDKILAVDEDLIPTGEYYSVAGTPFDFRQGKSLMQYLHPLHADLGQSLGFDHNYCFEPWTGELKKMVSVAHAQNGRVMEVHSTLPGAQLYTGNYLANAGFNPYSAFCIEPQFYPDSPNKPSFPFEWCSPGKPYDHSIEWQFRLE